jgi:hypothetical protein
MDSPASHQGTARPEAKNSEVLAGALAVEQGGAETDGQDERDDDPVDELKAHGYRPFAENAGRRMAGSLYEKMGTFLFNLFMLCSR